MSRPTTRAASAAACATSGWTWSVQSIATLPLRWISTHLAGLRAPTCAVRSWRLQFELILASSRGRSRSSGIFLVGAAARIAVDLAVDQLRPRSTLPSPVTRDDLAARGRDHLAADHQQAVLVAADEALDHHVAALAARPTAKAAIDVVAGRQSSSETPRPWLASEGLTTTGRPMSSAASQASSALAHHLAFGHRHAAACEQRLGQVLVAGDAIRRWRWCGRSRRSRCGAGWRRSRAAPGCRSLRRMCGMPRSVAASTMQAVLGPR